MMKTIDLKSMPRAELEEFAMEASSEADRLKALVEAKEAEIRLLRKEKFGCKSEKNKNNNTSDENQLSLFNDTEALAEPEKQEPKLEKVKPPRKPKKKGCKEAKLEKIPIKTTVYTLTEEERECPVCKSTMTEMKKVVRKELEIIPAKVIVHEHITQHYVCRQCEKNEVTTPIIHAPSPKPLLAASFLSPSMAAYILTRKYDNRDSIYKISSDFNNSGLKLSVQMISNWILRVAEDYAKPIYEKMWKQLLKYDYINADETVVQVLNEPGRNAGSKSYMWLYCSNHAEKPLVLYEYADSRGGKIPQKALKDYHGIVQCDGYDAYNSIEGIIRMGCFSHVRRKFYEAKESLDPKLPREASQLEQEAIDRCDRLFNLDKQVKKLPLDERLEWKKLHVRREMDDFFQWLEEKQANPESDNPKFQKAVKYALNERKYLENYFADGRVEMSNNLAERAVRPFVMGRKNWLFCNTPRGAEASAIWYSIIITAKENGLIPFEYLKYLLEELRGKDVSTMPDSELDKLLPWYKHLPPECYGTEQSKNE